MKEATSLDTTLSDAQYAAEAKHYADGIRRILAEMAANREEIKASQVETQKILDTVLAQLTRNP